MGDRQRAAPQPAEDEEVNDHEKRIADALEALVEQQRIANLVALGVIGGGPISNSSPTHAVQYLSSEYPDESKALGL